MTKVARRRALAYSPWTALIAIVLTAPAVLADRAFAAPAQAASSSIRGAVLDATGAPLAGATLTLVNLETDRRQRQPSTAEGAFQFLGLPPGPYRIVIERAGFASVERDIDLLVDQDRRLTVGLMVAGRTESAEVVAIAQPVVDHAKTSLGRTVTAAELEQLPILVPREFAALATLAPGVLPATNGPAAGVAAAGQTLSSNTTLMDGLSVDGFTGGPAIETIREYRIATNHFAAEFGQASGAVVSVVTRGGSNLQTGRVYYFQQHSALTATSAPARRVGAPDPGVQQESFGASWSGPIVRNRAFVFASFDQLLKRTTYTNTSPVALLFRPDDPLVVPVRWRVPRLFVRGDIQWSPSHLLTMRGSALRTSITNAAREAESGAERGRNVRSPFLSVAIVDTKVFGATLVNELRGQWGRDRFERDVNGFCPGCVALNYQSLLLGKPANDPQSNITTRAEVSDVLTWVLAGRGGEHLIKTGVSVNVVELGGVWPTNFAGTYTFTHDLPFDANDRRTYPIRFTQNLGDPRVSLGETIVSAFAQDDWRPHHALSINAGVRWDSTRWPGPNGQRNDVAPRLGVSFTPARRATTVVRAGLGRYYDESHLTTVREADGDQITMTIRNPGFQGDLVHADPHGINLNRLGPAIPVFSVNRFVPTRTPYSDQTSIGLQRQVGRAIGLAVDLVRARGKRLPIGWDVNYPDPATRLRPDPTLNQIVVTETRAESWYTGLHVGLQKSFSDGHAYTVAYTWSTSENNTDGPRNFPQDQANLAAERGPAPYDSRHRISASGTVTLPWDGYFSAVATARTGLPYNVTTGTDDNGDGVINDRPAGEGRNAARGAAAFQIDARLSKTWRVRARRVETFVEAFNVTNRANWTDYNGRRAAAAFGEPANAGPPRQVQLGARLTF